VAAQDRAGRGPRGFQLRGLTASRRIHDGIGASQRGQYEEGGEDSKRVDRTPAVSPLNTIRAGEDHLLNVAKNRWREDCPFGCRTRTLDFGAIFRYFFAYQICDNSVSHIDSYVVPWSPLFAQHRAAIEAGDGAVVARLRSQGSRS
jgi:hypothetical protein